MKTHCQKLLSIAGEPLIDSSPVFNKIVLDLAGNLGKELQNLLLQKNGFYCFESALHFFPSGLSDNTISLEHWNSLELWKQHYSFLADEYLFFAEDIFGGQFCIVKDKICTFDPETGDIEKIANNFETWAKCILDEYDFLTGFSLAHSWQEKYGEIPPGTRLLPKIPFIYGGEFKIDNLYLLDSITGMKLRADLAQQIQNSPDGTKIKFKIIE